MVSFLSYEVHQGGRWGWRRRLRTRADKRPKAVSSTSWLGQWPVQGRLVEGGMGRSRIEGFRC